MSNESDDEKFRKALQIYDEMIKEDINPNIFNTEYISVFHSGLGSIAGEWKTDNNLSDMIGDLNKMTTKNNNGRERVEELKQKINEIRNEKDDANE